MKRKTYRVSVVLDPSFGKKLFPLAKNNHVWACSSKENILASKFINKGKKTISIASGVTTFNFDKSFSPEQAFLGVLDDIDLHHGDESHEPPWNEIEVFGIKENAAIREKLKEYGISKTIETDEGFIARK